MICTDHAPHHYDAKEREFDDAPNGIIGLETALGLAITELVDGGLLDLPTLVTRMSTMPARIFNLPGGTLARGAAADVVVIDPAVRWTVEPETFYSKSRNTPFAGRQPPRPGRRDDRARAGGLPARRLNSAHASPRSIFGVGQVFTTEAQRTRRNTRRASHLAPVDHAPLRSCP